VFTILHLVPGGWSTIHTLAESAGKLRVFDFSPGFWKPYTFWAGLVGGAFLTTASHGTDQLIVQRLLAARSQRQSVAALLSSGLAILFLFALFLLVGVSCLPSTMFRRQRLAKLTGFIPPSSSARCRTGFQVC